MTAEKKSMAYEEEDSCLANNLSKLLKQKRISDKELSDSLGIPNITIKRLLSGQTCDPRISTLKSIADYLDIGLDTLISADGKSQARMPMTKPQLVPILTWQTLADASSIADIALETWPDWFPVTRSNNIALSNQTFALASTPSMQPRFRNGTIFIIEPEETPVDGDIILVKTEAGLTLRELILDPPRWQLLPLVSGSETLYLDREKDSIVGVAVLTYHNAR